MRNRGEYGFGCWLLLVGFALIFGTERAEARLASQFSLSVGEQFTDNVFFSDNKQHDLITIITPRLRLISAPSSTSASRLTVDLNAPAEIFARNSELNNIGDRLSLRTRFDYPYSRRLSFGFTECLGRLGKGRNGGFGDARRSGGADIGTIGTIGNFAGLGGVGGGQGGRCGGSGGFGGAGSGGSGSFANEGELVTRGEVLENNFEASSSFLATSNLTFRGAYLWRYLAFFDAGGRETSHGGEIQASYRRWPQHSLRARYRIEFLKSRNGKTDTIHDVDIGDEFLSSRQIQLTPTLTLAGSTGISLATGRSKFRLEHKLNVRLIKLWQTAVFQVGVRRGLTGSFGVGGPSFTTSFFSDFTLLLSRRLSVFTAVDYSMFDTDQRNFNTFVAGAGIRYNIFYWLSANLLYTYRRADPEGNSLGSISSLRGNTDSNAVFVLLSAAFDIWPQLGFGRDFEGLQNIPSSSPGGTSAPPISAPTP